MAKSASALSRPVAGPAVRCRAAIFDCDGLLLNTTPAWVAAFNAGAHAVKFRLTQQKRANLLGSSVESAAGRITAWAGQPDHTERVAETMRAALRAATHARPPQVLPGVANVLAQLNPLVPLGVASNAPADILTGMLTAAGLLDSFAEVVSADVVAEPKPAPDVYLAASKRLGVDPSQAIAFEDSRAGAMAAQSAGMPVVVVTADGWPARAPLEWPARNRPVLYVTSLGDPAVAAYVLGVTKARE